MTEPGDVWSALAHPSRRLLVDRLRTGPALTGELVALLDEHEQSSRFASLRHLKTLRDAGLVVIEQSGRERRNFLNGSALYQATIGWLDPPAREAARSLDRLKTVLDEQEKTMSTFRSFEISQQIDIDAAPDRVWAALTGDVGAWWGSPYLLIERPGSRIRIEAEIGRPVVETNGAEQRTWGTVSSLTDGQVLGWTGPMGMGSLAWGTVEFTLTPRGTGTRVGLTQASFGAFGERAGEGYRHGWDDLLHRLRAHLDDGLDYGVSGLNRAPEGLATAT